MDLASSALALTAALALVASTGCTSTCACIVPAANPSAGKPPVAAAAPSVPAPKPTRRGFPRLSDLLELPELPLPLGAANVPRPSGTPGNLKILDWAGFKSAVSCTFDDGQPSQIGWRPRACA